MKRQWLPSTNEPSKVQRKLELRQVELLLYSSYALDKCQKVFFPFAIAKGCKFQPESLGKGQFFLLLLSLSSAVS